MGIGDIWNLIAMRPVINILIVLSHYLFQSFGLSVIALTIVIRGLMYPLSIKQLRATKAMQEIQPKMAELQKKYAKDKTKLAQEQMRLYRESGMSPAGCVIPMVVQMPVWIALYWAIIKLLAVTPEDFLGLSGYLYSWPLVYSLLPLGSYFLWMNLAVPDSMMALLVGGSMWAQQKMVQPAMTDPKQQSQSQMMLWMMPLMFGFFALSFPSGLSLYWVVSNVLTIVMQYFITGGWGGLAISLRRGEVEKRPKAGTALQAPSSSAGTGTVESSSVQKEGLDNGKSGDKRQDRGGGYTKSPRAIRHPPRRSRDNRPKRR